MSDPVPPILEFDPDHAALIEPHVIRDPIDQVPAHAVLCFFDDVIKTLAASGARKITEVAAAHGVHPVYEVDVGGRPVVVFHPGVGAPLAGGFFEESIAFGCRFFVAIGIAGGLVPDLTLGHVVVPTAAIRDEGTSYHYAPAGREALPSPEAVAAIEETLTEHGVPYVAGKAWTTDAIFRETRDRTARRVAEGCVVVDMEASALFTIAAFRGVTIGQILVTADDLSGEEWDDRGWLDDAPLRDRLFWLAAEACLRL